MAIFQGGVIKNLESELNSVKENKLQPTKK
jgi:hypothetical protein